MPNGTVTPLHFRSLSRDRRRARRRASSVPGWQMEGNMHTLGYFSATVCVGSPPLKFDLIVDTGSSLTALPCADCTQCGDHRHGSVSRARFDEASSSTAEAIGCSRPPSGLLS